MGAARGVRFPFSQAKPAKLIPARFGFAGHVIAALVLLDRMLALRTNLCVESNPFDIHGLI